MGHRTILNYFCCMSEANDKQEPEKEKEEKYLSPLQRDFILLRAVEDARAKRKKKANNDGKNNTVK